MGKHLHSARSTDNVKENASDIAWLGGQKFSGWDCSVPYAYFVPYAYGLVPYEYTYTGSPYAYWQPICIWASPYAYEMDLVNSKSIRALQKVKYEIYTKFGIIQ